jgi:hypothetical protein
LGVASIFPVGSFYIAKAEIADRGSAIAQAVMSDITARGMLNPWAWYVMTPSPQSNSLGHPNYEFQSVDGKYTTNRAPIAGTFTRPFAETLLEGLRVNSIQTAIAGLAAAPGATTVTKQFGSAYVIDPMYVAAACVPNQSFPNNRIAYAYPASAWMTPARNGGQYYSHTGWDPWKAANFNQLTWPIRRATLQQSNGWQLGARMAEHLFRGTDELATEFPDRDDRPAAQNWDVLVNNSGGSMPLARQWVGDYSWIVCVVPTTSAARDGMARNPESFAYDVSVVVFYKRPLPAGPPQSSAELMNAAVTERAVGAKIVSTGLTGGELLLTDIDNSLKRGSSESAFTHLKTGQWIMLCGPHPNSSVLEPRFALNWYQVQSIDTEGTGIANFDPTIHRVVAVRGPQWPWLPAQDLTNYQHLSNDLCVGICRGAVAVHTRTLRLDSSRSGGGMAIAVPPGVPGPNYVPR